MIDLSVIHSVTRVKGKITTDIKEDTIDRCRYRYYNSQHTEQLPTKTGIFASVVGEH